MNYKSVNILTCINSFNQKKTTNKKGKIYEKTSFFYTNNTFIIYYR